MISPDVLVAGDPHVRIDEGIGKLRVAPVVQVHREKADVARNVDQPDPPVELHAVENAHGVGRERPAVSLADGVGRRSLWHSRIRRLAIRRCRTSRLRAKKPRQRECRIRSPVGGEGHAHLGLPLADVLLPGSVDRPTAVLGDARARLDFSWKAASFSATNLHHQWSPARVPSRLCIMRSSGRRRM